MYGINPEAWSSWAGNLAFCFADPSHGPPRQVYRLPDLTSWNRRIGTDVATPWRRVPPLEPDTGGVIPWPDTHPLVS